jgi:hypothetical protein
MNLRRGIIRAWTLLAVLWFGGVAVEIWSDFQHMKACGEAVASHAPPGCNKLIPIPKESRPIPSASGGMFADLIPPPPAEQPSKYWPNHPVEYLLALIWAYAWQLLCLLASR